MDGRSGWNWLVGGLPSALVAVWVEGEGGGKLAYLLLAGSGKVNLGIYQ